MSGGKSSRHIHEDTIPLTWHMSVSFTPLSLPLSSDLWLHNCNCWRAAASPHDSTKLPGCRLNLLLFCFHLRIAPNMFLINSTLFRCSQENCYQTKSDSSWKHKSCMPSFVLCNSSAVDSGHCISETRLMKLLDVNTGSWCEDLDPGDGCLLCAVILILMYI